MLQILDKILFGIYAANLGQNPLKNIWCTDFVELASQYFPNNKARSWSG